MWKSNFTFQYGDIQIELVAILENAYAIFTFQYGDIQIPPIYRHTCLFLPFYIPIWWYSNSSVSHPLSCATLLLHSNMVIFKCTVGCCPINWLAAFTFQYGDIQIWDDWDINKRQSFFYIPIWWYSNLCKIVYAKIIEFVLHSNMVIFKYGIPYLEANVDKFYIPIWWYSNQYLQQNSLTLHKVLHSNMVIFK